MSSSLVNKTGFWVGVLHTVLPLFPVQEAKMIIKCEHQTLLCGVLWSTDGRLYKCKALSLFIRTHSQQLLAIWCSGNKQEGTNLAWGLLDLIRCKDRLARCEFVWTHDAVLPASITDTLKLWKINEKESQVMKTGLTPSAAISGSLPQFNFPHYQSLSSKEMYVLEADCFPSRYKLMWLKLLP